MSSEADVEAAINLATAWREKFDGGARVRPGPVLPRHLIALAVENARLEDRLQRYEAALRDIANYYAYCRDTQGEGDSPCARRAREALALDSPATQETVE